MNFFKKKNHVVNDQFVLPDTQSTEPPEPPVVEPPKFTIDYYPISQKYYPKIDGKFISYCYLTHLYSIERFISAGPIGIHGKTEAEAREIIAAFKEQHYKTNVITIIVE